MTRGDFSISTLDADRSRRELLLVSREGAFASLGSTRGKSSARGEFVPEARDADFAPHEEFSESLWGELSAELSAANRGGAFR